VILSIRPRGLDGFDPKRHANAPGARERVGAFVVRRIIGAARTECQTWESLPTLVDDMGTVQ
jgi:hypothetical protein